LDSIDCQAPIMSAGRFFVSQSIIEQPDKIIMPPSIAQQIRQVLRLRSGENIVLLDGTGMSYTVLLDQVSHDQVIGHIISSEQVKTEPHSQVTIYQGLIKSSKFEWIIQKGTELGVSGFVPFACVRSLSGLEEASASKIKRWETIATEAVEQSERGRIPSINLPLSFQDALADAKKQDIILGCWEENIPGQSISIRETMQRRSQQGNNYSLQVAIFIGPEGGFTSDEIQSIASQGAYMISLGPRILRAETAAIVAATLVLDALGELE
jgi:16S rRNA (uracil1498-N3)-methyltransferase